MADSPLHKEYGSNGNCVQDLFDAHEEGFFVPLYQREYTWEEDNINQLFDDLVLGAGELVEHEDTATFLGTTILTTISDRKRTVRKGEDRAQPTAVQLVIDGQQRMSTLALISIQITVKLRTLLESIPHKEPYSILHNNAENVLERLQKLHTIKLGKGADPAFKPKIIREREDLWTYTGGDDSYGSPVAHYIAKFIRTDSAQEAIKALDSSSASRVKGNIELIDQWLNRICDAHIKGSALHGHFPAGPQITKKKIQEYILGFSERSLKNIIDKQQDAKDHNDYFACAVYQVFFACYYLLQRCGVSRLEPSHEEWGFDMFQALNATGTPLTVLETFVPQVMQAEQNAGNEWRETPSMEHMDEIQRLFESTSTNEMKNKRTNELIGAFGLCYDGEKLGNKFSVQRRWLTNAYDKDLSSIQEKRTLLSQLAKAANFYSCGWYMENVNERFRIKGLEHHPEGQLASLSVQFLRDSNSSLSAPILARYYSDASDNGGGFDEFASAAKACAAFFTLWRSSNSTSGLDDVYRKFFKEGSSPNSVDRHWKGHAGPLKANMLKEYFLDALAKRGVIDRNSWIEALERFLQYTEHKVICKFVLFLAGHDRIDSKDRPGLTSAGTKGSCPLLILDFWRDKRFRTIEHIAPQNPPTGHKWDQLIYDEGLVHHIGNLTLSPLDLNKFADNKDWKVKYLYYLHTGERDQQTLDALTSQLKERGIVLSIKALRSLSNAPINPTFEPILNVGQGGNWNSTLVNSRSRQIKEIAFDRLMSWLSP